MKKIIIFLAVGLGVLFVLFLLARGQEDTGNSESEIISRQESEEGKNSSVSEETREDYSVVIDSYRLAKDYADKDVVIIKYIFSNISDDDPAAFYVTFDANVYQNGVGLNEAYFVEESANYSADNQTKEVKKGASLVVEAAYELNDTTSDIDVEVERIFNFSDFKITKTFSLAS